MAPHLKFFDKSLDQDDLAVLRLQHFSMWEVKLNCRNSITPLITQFELTVMPAILCRAIQDFFGE